ncbi:DUF1385 domain-containing protein [Gudongella sp. DL1XJH-153]|uniref:DUF1385 domain-containing protein n=1 Tax=Gudongella sp. DL1XJH-153 TaxID=3409804 RepID=UPI003BB7B42D
MSKTKIDQINVKHKTSIGGQAIIEGVMMRGPEKIAIAVRKPNKEIELKVNPIKSVAKKYKILGLPFIRGMVGLIEALKIGTGALLYSAEFFEDEQTLDKDGNPKKTITQKIFKDKAQDVEMALAVVLSITLTIGIFMVLPNIITNFLKGSIQNTIVLNLIEGIIRISIFLLYVVWVSKLDDVKRVFQYHGAEHKSIHCYENEMELTVENVKRFPILHARCGTSFLFMVMAVSIVVLSFFGWPNPVMRVLTRVLMFPVIAGISYEINRFIGRSDSRLCYALSYPGLMIQKYATVKEPDESQIEVAIQSLLAVIPEDKEADRW